MIRVRASIIIDRATPDKSSWVILILPMYPGDHINKNNSNGCSQKARGIRSSAPKVKTPNSMPSVAVAAAPEETPG